MTAGLNIQRLLMKMREIDASDLHIKVGVPPVMRIASKLHRIDGPSLSEEQTRELLLSVVPEALTEDLKNRGSVDFSLRLSEGERFRCSVFHADGGLHAAFRRINPVIPDFKSLMLPPVYEKFTSETHDGLVVVCGVTGSGKSSTLAAMIQHINQHRHCNIITIEDPVEYAFEPIQSFISQREIGLDTPDFPTALRAAVRQDPDVMMIGELRDRETVLAGIQAAETGHLVFVTLHTADTMQAFSRMLEFFPNKEHDFIRSSLAVSLRAVCAQRLIPSILPDAPRVPATEVLLNTSLVAERIRDGADEDLPAVLAGSQDIGMHDFTTSLHRMVNDSWIDLKIAEKYAPNIEALRSKVRGIEVKADVLVSKARR